MGIYIYILKYKRSLYFRPKCYLPKRAATKARPRLSFPLQGYCSLSCHPNVCCTPEDLSGRTTSACEFLVSTAPQKRYYHCTPFEFPERIVRRVPQRSKKVVSVYFFFEFLVLTAQGGTCRSGARRHICGFYSTPECYCSVSCHPNICCTPEDVSGQSDFDGAKKKVLYSFSSFLNEASAGCRCTPKKVYLVYFFLSNVWF